jgi:hypothetical protein
VAANTVHSAVRYRPTRAFPHRLDYAVMFTVTVPSILDQEVVAVDLE